MQFHLIPYEKHLASLFEIQGEMFFDEEYLWVVYTLFGNLALLEIAPFLGTAQRKNFLWEQTCFELFVKRPSTISHSYIEFNFSPSGDYNCYCFEKYREGMREPALDNPLPIKVWQDGKQLQVMAKIPLDLLFALLKQPLPDQQKDQVLFQFAASAVLLSSKERMKETKEGADHQKSYWALEHKGERPDFHREDSFLLQIQLPPPLKLGNAK